MGALLADTLALLARQADFVHRLAPGHTAQFRGVQPGDVRDVPPTTRAAGDALALHCRVALRLASLLSLIWSLWPTARPTLRVLPAGLPALGPAGIAPGVPRPTRTPARAAGARRLTPWYLAPALATVT